MRISDWSSDVCSSDLQELAQPVLSRRAQDLERGRRDRDRYPHGGVSHSKTRVSSDETTASNWGWLTADLANRPSPEPIGSDEAEGEHGAADAQEARDVGAEERKSVG